MTDERDESGQSAGLDDADESARADQPVVDRRQALTLGAGALAAGAIGGSTLAQMGSGDGIANTRTYRVTVANLTSGQPFTPPAVAAHTADVEVFAVGDPANEPTRQLAENGNLDPLLGFVDETTAIRGAAVAERALVPESDPGNTGLPSYTSVTLTAPASAGYLTFVSMLIATNDGIVGLDTVELPDLLNESRTYYANGYDVGTEENTELFTDMVPAAKTLIIGGEPEGSAESSEDLATDDVIHPHPGIEGVGNLPPQVYDWDEPAALVQVERVEPEPEEPPTTTTTDVGDGETETDTGDDETETKTGDDGTETETGDDETETETGDDETETDSGDEGTETETGDDETETETGDGETETDSGDEGTETGTETGT